MNFAYLVGLNVVDDHLYDRYRARMTPILTRFGGDFGLDVDVSHVRTGPVEAGVNRLFTIRFPDRATDDAFFADRDYLRVKAEYFDRAVAKTVMLGEVG